MRACFFLIFYWQDFTVAQRERAQEDFRVLEGEAFTLERQHSTGVTLLFSNSSWVLLRPTEISTIKELWDGSSGLSSLSEMTRKSNQLQRQYFTLSYLMTLSVGPVGVSESRTHDLPRHSPVHNEVNS